MLVIRMQRTGRKGHAMFRVVVQDSRLTPTSGKVVALLGSYDPHNKSATLDGKKASFYMEHGAQPSDRVTQLFKTEKIKLPKWVSLADEKKRTTRNPEKLRKNRPVEEKAEVSTPVPVAEVEIPATEEEKPVEAVSEETPVAEEKAETEEE
jgi:small subunit ribosomal protein S16